MKNEVIEFSWTPLDERLQSYIPTGTFNPSRQIIPIERRRPITGLPDTLKDVQVLHDFVDRDQFFYQAFRAGDITDELWSRISEGIDTTQLTSEWLDGVIISVLLGTDSDGQRVVILDRDNDGDFIGEPPLLFEPDSLPGTGEIIMSSEAPLRFTYVEAGAAREREARVRLFYEADAPPREIGWQPLEYRSASWTLRGQTVPIALAPYPVLRSGKYTFLYMDLNNDGRFDPDPTGVEAYSTDEPFNVAGSVWRIDHLSADGALLNLESVDAPLPPRTALTEGASALPFSATALTGSRVSLESLRGKYVLLNFGWTGCPYSLAELPFLREAHAAFGGKGLVIVSVVEAEGEAQLRHYVREHELNWAHINQGRSGDIGRTYRVVGTPTNYLIGPDGAIVATGLALRGDSLHSTLGRHLGGL